MKKYFILILLTSSLTAQINDSITFTHSSKILYQEKDHYGIGISAYSDDFLLGLSYNSIISSQLGLSYKISLWVRPFFKDILHQEDISTYYIFRENRVQLLFGLEKFIALSNVIDIYSSISISPTMFFYNGSDRDYMDLIMPVLDAGFSFKMGNNPYLHSYTRIAIGYRFSRESINRHGFYLMFRIPL